MINCLIVDDEPLAIKIIENYLNKYNEFKIMNSFEDAFEASEYLQNHKIDLLFLDVQMPEITGLELVKNLNERPYTIIITAYRDFAIESYELAIDDYLLKPVSFSRFNKAINRARKKINAKNENTKETKKQYINKESENFLTVKEKYKKVRINIEEITFIESFREYSHVHTNNQTIITRQNLSSLEQELDEKGFLRVHKSFLINLRKIKSFSPNEIFLDKISIPIGRSFKKLVEEKLNNL